MTCNCSSTWFMISRFTIELVWQSRLLQASIRTALNQEKRRVMVCQGKCAGVKRGAPRSFRRTRFRICRSCRLDFGWIRVYVCERVKVSLFQIQRNKKVMLQGSFGKNDGSSLPRCKIINLDHKESTHAAVIHT